MCYLYIIHRDPSDPRKVYTGRVWGEPDVSSYTFDSGSLGNM